MFTFCCSRNIILTSADKDQSLLNFHGLLPEETAKEAAVQILRSADAECRERECVPASRMKLQSFVSLSLKFHMEMLTPVNGKVLRTGLNQMI